jgi:hypothetical protein
MKLTVNSSRLNEGAENFLGRAGYGAIFDRRRGVGSFVRRLGSGFYPRLHMYVEELGDKISFNLHLDQKQASYEGAAMHNAEYDSEVVVREINRLKELIMGSDEVAGERHEAPRAAVTQNYQSNSGSQTGTAQGDWRRDLQALPQVKKGWFKKLFG